MEFLVTTEVRLPAGITPEEKARLYAEERQIGLDLVRTGAIDRIWRIPGAPYRTVSIRIAENPDEMQAHIESLPLFDWLKVEVVALAQHAVVAEAALPPDR